MFKVQAATGFSHLKFLLTLIMCILRGHSIKESLIHPNVYNCYILGPVTLLSKFRPFGSIRKVFANVLAGKYPIKHFGANVL